MPDLEEIFAQLVASGCYKDQDESELDDKVLRAIQQRDRNPLDRSTALVAWLNHDKVLMSFTIADRTRAAEQILTFADERSSDNLPLELNSILTEFRKLEERIRSVAPRTKAGEVREVTSLTSKALWCCYPLEVPIYDRNAVAALGVICRLFNIVPTHIESKYAEFLDRWLQIYCEVESAIDLADLTECRQKVRVFDRILWHLGQG